MTKRRKTLFISLTVIGVIILFFVMYYYCFFLFRIGTVAISRNMVLMHLREMNKFDITLKGYTLPDFVYSFSISSAHELDLKSPRELLLLTCKNPKGEIINLRIQSSDLELTKAGWGDSSLYNYWIKPPNDMYEFYKENGTFEFRLHIKDRELDNVSLWFSYKLVAGTYAPISINVRENSIKIGDLLK
jgi:hypothetical protein